MGGAGTDPITCTASKRARVNISTHAGQPPAPAAARAAPPTGRRICRGSFPGYIHSGPLRAPTFSQL